MVSKEKVPVFEASLWSSLSYLQPSDELRTNCLNGVKRVFDFYKSQAARLSLEVPTGPLDELYTEEFDNEQIWAEIELLNEPALKSLKKQVKKAATWKTDTSVKTSVEPVTTSEVMSSIEDGVEGDETVSEDGVDSEEGLGGVGRRGREGGRRSIVDDQFFKLAEMERFLEQSEKQEEIDAEADPDSDDEDIDYFTGHVTDSDSDTGSVEQPHYADFFDSPEPAEPRGGDHGDGGEGCEAGGGGGDVDSSEDSAPDGAGGLSDLSEGSDGGDPGEGGEASEESDGGEGSDPTLDNDKDSAQPLSSHEKKQLKMKQRIAELEAVNLAPKSWQLAGETSAKERPLNSLLAEDLSFDHTSRPAPVVTEETTKTLEDIIKQRILDEAWDDVERKIKPAEKPYDYSRSRPLEQEKSKLSLAEVYEQEYLKQTQAEEETKEDTRHTEIKELMKKLFVKLDALSNFHFTPKPPKPDVKIAANVPAIQMEEVAPVAISNASRLAPEEVQSKSNRPEVGTTEKSDTDRKHDRRLKKRRKRLQIAEKKQREKAISKLRPGLGNKFTRSAMEKRLKEREQDELVDKSLKSSSRFFAKLQDQVKEQVKSVRKEGELGRRRTASAHQYKL